MNEYTASDGVKVEWIENGDQICVSAPVDGREFREWTGGRFAQALREFFRAEEDERLGRWRWPENPDYVVYPKGDGIVLAMGEHSGRGVEAIRTQANHTRTALHDAARAYFDAHPEPKPWHNAKPREVWVLSAEDGDEATTGAFEVKWNGSPATGHVYFARVGGNEHSMTYGNRSAAITAGRRIWPEGD